MKSDRSEPGMEEDEQVLFERLRSLQKKAAVGIVALLVIVFVCLPILFLLWEEVGFVAIVAAVPVGFFAFISQSKYTKLYKEKVVRFITMKDCDFMENMTFEPDKGISQKTLLSTGMINTASEVSSNDLITAEYKGVPFAQSDVHIEEVHHTEDGTTRVTIFRGRWISYVFNKDFRCELQVYSKDFGAAIDRSMAIGNGRLHRVKFENEGFNKTFKTNAGNQEEAFYLLTPHLMESLMELKKSLKAPVMLMFTGGHLHIAVHNNKDAFEPRLFGRLDPEKERTQILSDIRLITDFVDEFAMDRDIYKH